MEQLDAVVIGASIRGLVAATVLDRLGYRSLLIDARERPGGVDGSFVTAGGTRFDHGLHVLDYMRSELATRLFTRVTNDEVHRVLLRRGIVLRGELVPYAPRPTDLPDSLRKMLHGDDLVDDIGDALPTHERLARCYGRDFADLIYDEVLPSYPTEARHLAFGVDESKLLTNIYPWLFPRARRQKLEYDESRAFHDLLRDGVDQEILYPRSGGFGGFAEALLGSLDPTRTEVLLGADDLQVEIEPGTHTARSVAGGGRHFRAPRYLWGSSWPALCALLDLPCEETATDQFVLGSFVLDRPIRTPYLEILVGDPALRINRISFPARFRESDDPLVQVEFAFPVAEEWPEDADSWRSRWVGDLRRLELLEDSHRIEEFDFRIFRLHYNGFGMEGQALLDPDPSLVRSDGNLHPIVPSLANLNLNSHVPRSVEQVIRLLCAMPEAI
jgi:hypothetical protein